MTLLVVGITVPEVTNGGDTGELLDDTTASYRWGMAASSLPVAFLLLSVPVAFLSTAAAAAMWFLSAPVQLLAVNRIRPAEAENWFGAQ